MSWITELSAHFPRGNDTPLPHPVKSFFVCEREQILYAPIAKVACSSLKTLMLELCQIEHDHLIVQHGVHRVTDAFNTGAQLKDHKLEKVRQILASPDYYKFAVIREPLARVVSAYTEKFWRNRQQQDNKTCTQHALRAVQHSSTPDFDQSISFRDFVAYVTACDPAQLDPHWAPQTGFLAGVDKYNDVFTVEQLDILAQRIATITGRDVTIPNLNSSKTEQTTAAQRAPGHLADTPVTDLDALGNARTEDFLSPELAQKLRDYYREDVELYAAASRGLQNFEPLPVALDGMPKTQRAKDSAADIARAIQLYSKGYCGLSDQGSGNIPVVIANGSMQPLNMAALQSCHLRYVCLDAQGEALHAPLTQPLYLNILAVGAFHHETLAVTVPAAVRERTRSLTVSLLFNENIDVTELNPLHITSARLAN